MKDIYSKTTVNINGEIIDAENAKISVFDRGFLFGDSIYEVSYTTKRSILFYEEHMDRLFNSAKLLNMNIFLDRDELTEQIMKTLKASDLDEGYFRLIITRGESEISLNPNLSTHNNFVIMVKPRPNYSKELYDKGIDLLLSNVIRNPKNATDPNAKSGNYLNNVMAISEAKKKGYSDAIMVNGDGQLTEGTTFNFWIIKGKQILTPMSDNGLLMGITRHKVLELKEVEGLEIKEAQLFPKDIFEADEMFITSSTRGVMPISKVLTNTGLKEFKSFNKTHLIANAYGQLVESYLAKSKYKY